MVEKIVGFFKSGVGVILIVLMITAMLVFWGFTDGLFSFGKGKMTSQADSVMSMSFNALDGKPVRGAEVITYAREYKTEAQFSVLVKTKATPAGYYVENNSTGAATVTAYAVPSTAGAALSSTPGTASPIKIATMEDQNSPAYYVNTSATFDAKIYRTPDQVVRLVEFIQR